MFFSRGWNPRLPSPVTVLCFGLTTPKFHDLSLRRYLHFFSRGGLHRHWDKLRAQLHLGREGAKTMAKTNKWAKSGVVTWPKTANLGTQTWQVINGKYKNWNIKMWCNSQVEMGSIWNQIGVDLKSNWGFDLKSNWIWFEIKLGVRFEIKSDLI